jgi:hypothetical protein
MAGGIYIQFRCLFLLAFYLYIMLTRPPIQQIVFDEQQASIWALIISQLLK